MIYLIVSSAVSFYLSYLAIEQWHITALGVAMMFVGMLLITISDERWTDMKTSVKSLEGRVKDLEFKVVKLEDEDDGGRDK